MYNILSIYALISTFIIGCVISAYMQSNYKIHIYNYTVISDYKNIDTNSDIILLYIDNTYRKNIYNIIPNVNDINIRYGITLLEDNIMIFDASKLKIDNNQKYCGSIDKISPYDIFKLYESYTNIKCGHNLHDFSNYILDKHY